MSDPLQPSEQHPFSPTSPTRAPVPERLELAKWPPDDDDLPGGGGAPAQPLGGGGGPIGPYDADFRKGRFNPKIVLVFILLVVGGALLAVFALKSEASKMTLEQISAIKKNIYVLPKADRVTKWRELAGQTDEFELQQEALIQLGWEGDKSAIPLAIKG